MMGRRFGMKIQGIVLLKNETNVDKIKARLLLQVRKKIHFLTVTGDGKVTFADILKGRGGN